MSRMASIFGLILSTVAAPSSAVAGPGWSAPANIASFISTETGLTIILEGNSGPLSCTSTTWFRINNSDPNYAMISSALLTAFTQGKPVKLWESECNSDGTTHFIAAWVDK